MMVTRAGKKKASKKVYVIDNCTYSTKKLVTYHEELQKLLLSGKIKSFHLPQITENFKSKYHNLKPVIDEITFDSIDESKFYLVVKQMKKDKVIKSFELQKRYELLPAFVDHSGKKTRKMEYIADFVLYYPDDTIRVIDVKGIETSDFKLKRKLFNYINKDSAVLECMRFIGGEWLDDAAYKEYRKNKKKAKKTA